MKIFWVLAQTILPGCGVGGVFTLLSKYHRHFLLPQKYGKRPALIYGYCLLTESFFFFVLFLITLVYLLLFEEKTSVLSLEVMVLFGWMLALVDAILYIRYKRTPEQYSDLENKLPILKILSNYFS